MTRNKEIDAAIKWAEALPVLGDSPKAKLLAEEVKRLEKVVTETIGELEKMAADIIKDAGYV